MYTRNSTLTQADYNERCIARQKSEGLTRVSVMVPVDDAKTVKDIAARLRSQHYQKLEQAADNA